MAVKQISVFIQNKKGRLAKVSRLLADNNIYIRALSIADTQDFGILRLICEDVDNVNSVLKEAGYLTTITDVLVAKIKDDAGALAIIAEALRDADISIEYVYELATVDNIVYLVVRVDDNKAAAAALAGAGVKTANEEEIFKL